MSNNAADVITIISNIFFIAPAWLAGYKGLWTRCAIYLCIIAFSSIYHTCNSYAGACLFDPLTCQRLDFFFAQFVIPLTALYLIIFPPLYRFVERLLLIAFALAIFIIMYFCGLALIVQTILVGVALTMLIIFWIMYACLYNRFPPYRVYYLCMGLLLTFLACALFAVQSAYHQTYWAVHGCWHLLAAMGQYYLLQVRPRDPAASVMSLDQKIKLK